MDVEQEVDVELADRLRETIRREASTPDGREPVPATAVATSGRRVPSGSVAVTTATISGDSGGASSASRARPPRFFGDHDDVQRAAPPSQLLVATASHSSP
jgi:hypothetical protein